MKRCIIMRGIPGSGKTTYVKTHYPDAWVVSADHHFMNHFGEYRLDIRQLPAAHANCLKQFVRCVRNGSELVVVDNTNITVAEIAPYCALALAYGYELQIITLLVDTRVAWGRNVHGVPLPICNVRDEIMRDEQKRFPIYWPHLIMDPKEPHDEATARRND